MSWLIVILLITFTVILVFLTQVLFKKIFSGSIEKENSELIEKSKESVKELKEALEKKGEQVSKLQLHTVSIQCDETEAQIKDEKAKLETVDKELGVVKKRMDEKEILQQELKTSKEEDEKELQASIDNYEKNSKDSRELEKVLAEQMKVLDEYSKDQNIENIHRDFFNALNETLEESGGNLRNVITEYEQMMERIIALKQQLSDLEVEYTNLVEGKLRE
ncbi:MAG: hypothetical protein ACOX3T_08490 [Bdellovibrionota bacterium]